MICQYCNEVVTADEIQKGNAAPINDGRSFMHRECLVRSVAGSVTHIRRACKNFGGVLDCHECEQGLTIRQAARNSLREILFMRCPPN